jgi:DNA-binding response OmpR family regulator
MRQKHETSVSILTVGEFEPDRPLLQEITGRFGWRLFEAPDRYRALQTLAQHPIQVVLAESHMPQWDWKKVLRDLRRMPHPPQLIVASRTADDRLWAEVLNIGGYDVLPKPLERDEVERVVAAAVRHYQLPASAVSGVSAPAASVA